MINETYTVDILVNDKPIRKFPHNDKLFVEAHKGAEYSIRIKNNSYSRILAITSVDGLDVLTGKSASENGNGYVINGYGTLKIDGFRVSNEQVAKFLFDYKGGSYAASKEDGSEKNVGVVGVRIFSEKVKPRPPIVIREEHHHHHDHYPVNPYRPWWDRPYFGDTTIWSAGLTGSPGGPTYGSSCNYDGGMSSRSDESLSLFDTAEHDTTKYSCDKIPTKGAPSAPSAPKRRSGDKLMGSSMKSAGLSNMSNHGSAGLSNSSTSPEVMRSLCSSIEPLGFDMGTKWGEAKESKVIEVEFEKGLIALTTNIYYASRQSLIEMGVPLGNEKQVSFPEPFKDGKYAEPPKGWQG